MTALDPLSFPAICLSSSSLLKSYQRTPRLRLFRSSLTTFEVLQQLLVERIHKQEDYCQHLWVWIQVVTAVIPVTTVLWGRGYAILNLVGD